MTGSFYTAKGDDGFTGLLGEGRVPKDDARIEALGAVDEAGAALGAARAFSRGDLTRQVILRAQSDLYGLMGEVAATKPNAARFRVIDAARVAWLEEQIAAVEKVVQVPREFIVPGDTIEGGMMDVARAVVRRAERRVTSLLLAGELENNELVRYLNRLSSLVYLLELFENQLGGSKKITFAKAAGGE